MADRGVTVGEAEHRLVLESRRLSSGRPVQSGQQDAAATSLGRYSAVRILFFQ